MSDDPTKCFVTLTPEMAVGAFSNAFRIIHDTGTEYFLDFLVHSTTDKQAKVVARIRVHESFLSLIQGRFTAALQEIQTSKSIKPVVHGGNGTVN